MSNSWLPRWLEVAGTVIYLVILASHAVHALTVRGRSRAWHGVHVLMALGMLDMFWPADEMPVAATPAKIVFTLAGVGALGATVWFSRGGRDVAWLWLIATVDLGAMVYMFQMMASTSAVVTIALAAWFLIEAAGWGSGLLSATAGRQSLSVAADPEAAPGAVDVEAPGTGADASAVGRSTVAVLTERRHRSYASAVRLSLVVMALGMAYMLLAMQYGTTAMPMPGPMTM
jgi:hypothetical protein